MRQHQWALLSGFLGATASCLVKLAVSNDDASPLVYLSEEYCQPRLTVDLDTELMKRIHWALGTLMVRYRINFTRIFKVFKDAFDSAIIGLGIFEVDWCRFCLLLPRLLCLVAMLLLNAYMIACFLRGLKVSGSVVGTALSSAANFSFSALYGALLWQERFDTTWWIGFASVMTGVLILSGVQTVAEDDKTSTTTTTTTTARTFKTSSTTSKKPYHSFATKKWERPKPPANPPPVIRPKFTPPPKKTAAELKQYKKDVAIPKRDPLPVLLKKKRTLTTALIDRTFANECVLCGGALFDESSGGSISAVADLSPNCFHVMHAKCLKQEQASVKRGKSKCPVCDKSISMWISAKQAAHFGGFWLDRIEAVLQKLGPVKGEKGLTQPRPASEIREILQNDDSLDASQKKYIDDDPTGLGKGLASGLEWGGYVDYNDCLKGHVGWELCLRTRGLWRYDAREDDVWLWEWGDAHPRQRCEQCQLKKRPLAVACPGCAGSSEAAFYCSEPCQKRDWRRHKMTCVRWQQNGPEKRSNGK